MAGRAIPTGLAPSELEGNELPPLGVGEDLEAEEPVEGVPRLEAAVDAQDWYPQEGKVPDGVKDLVADELVGGAEALRVDNPSGVKHHRVVQRTAAGEPRPPERFDLLKEAEGAGKRHLAAVGLGGELEVKLLAADDGVVELDDEVDPESPPGVVPLPLA